MSSSYVSPFRSDILKGKVVFITGGATGICFGIATIFGRHGAKLAITGRRKQVLDDAVHNLQKEGIDVVGFNGDVRDYKAIESIIQKVVSHFGRLDIVINGAAGNFLCAPQDLSSNAFQTVVAIDLLGTFNVSRAAFEALKATKGNIINISATLHYGSTLYQTHASAAKAGVDSLTRSLAAEWGQFGIRVNGIAPGPIADTEGMKRLSGGRTEKGTAAIPLQRYGTSYEIANAAVFLASDLSAGYISGDTLVVDGGSWLAGRSHISAEQYQFIQQETKRQKEEKQKSRL
jgi:peroxisomal 2,4-dienoyl-CoA reductase